MITFFSWVIATIITVPMIALFLIYHTTFFLTKNKRKSFHNMINYSTVFFIISVYFLIYVIWEKAFFWTFILILISFAMFFLFLQWKFSEELLLRKVWKGFWRFCFIIFFLSYWILVFIGLFSRIKAL